MVKDKYLTNSLSKLSYPTNEIKSVKYTKNLITNLFEKYQNYKMEEEFFCCSGAEYRCWVEVIEEGVWNLTQEEVKAYILSSIKKNKKYLYNGRRYGQNRVHIYEDTKECYVFIYLRDLIGCDYSIWFDTDVESR